MRGAWSSLCLQLSLHLTVLGHQHKQWWLKSKHIFKFLQLSIPYTPLWTRWPHPVCLVISEWSVRPHINSSPLDKTITILQTTHSNAFSWMKTFVFWFEFHWSLFLRAQLTIIKHWFRWWLGAEQATSHYLNQCLPSSLMHICSTRGRWVYRRYLKGKNVLFVFKLLQWCFMKYQQQMMFHFWTNARFSINTLRLSDRMYLSVN